MVLTVTLCHQPRVWISREWTAVTEQGPPAAGALGPALATAHPAADKPEDAQSSASRASLVADVPVDRVKAVVSLIVAGFAGVMSYIGLQGTDLTTVMRTQSRLVQLMGLFVLLAVVSAVLSVFSGQLNTRGT
jgi:hypothetical protein